MGQLADGVEFWRGYYQSIRPTQMGLSLNIDASARPFYEPVSVPEFIAKNLNLRDLSRPLSDSDRVKVKNALRGVTVETNHRNYRKSFKVTGVSTEPANQLMFAQSDDNNSQMSVSRYFKEKYKITLRYPSLPCIKITIASMLEASNNCAQLHWQTYRFVSTVTPLTSLPMEVCTIVGGQKYRKKMNERQLADLHKATCQRPHEREENIKKIIKDNRYAQNSMVSTEFGMNISETCATVNARVLPPPMLMYNEKVTPGVGQWNMTDKKMYDGAKVTNWSCINFSTKDCHLVDTVCSELVAMCVNKGMKFEEKPCVPIRSVHSALIEIGLSEVYYEALRLNKPLQLLIIILPDNTGSYRKIKKICETELGVVTQCLKPETAGELNGQYFESMALKINVKAGGSNTVLCDAMAIGKTIPLLTDIPTMIIGADVIHASPGDGSTASVTAVVASMDWPHVTKYKGIISAQGHGEEIIQDLYKLVVDPRTGKSEHGGIMRELLKSFHVLTKRKPDRIIFYRGVSEGQFADVLLHEVVAIRKACVSLEEDYLPRLTFVVVQKMHHTRLFPVNHKMTDESGNILPGTVVDTQICHPSQFDFYLNSHAGIQGTSRPTHYHVLHDENNFTPDLLQLLTNSLCYTYARCTRSVSVVPPVHYAHRLALRARCYLEGSGVSERGSTGGEDMTKGQQLEIQSLPQVKKTVSEVMYFC